MADNAWSQSGCKPDVWVYGIPGSGSWLWTARFGQYWVGGVVYQLFAAHGYECGGLGPPVKAYGFISEFNGEGQWYHGGVIVYRYDTRRWHVYGGDFGQTAGRLTDGPTDVSNAVELYVSDVGADLPNYVTPKAPKPSKEMKA